MRNPANPPAHLVVIPSLPMYYEVGQVSSKFTRIRVLTETSFTQSYLCWTQLQSPGGPRGHMTDTT